MKTYKFLYLFLVVVFCSHFNLFAQDAKYSGGSGDGYSSSSFLAIGGPASFSAATGGIKQINLSWTKNSESNDVIVAYNTINIFGTPVNSTSYSAGDAISGGGTVVYSGSGTSTTQGALNEGTTYYYKIWSNSSNTYSISALTANAATTAGASTVASNLSATETGIQTITLSWSQNGSNDDVIVAYTTDGTFGTPVDGTSYSVDGTISGGGTILVNGNSTTYEHKYLSGGNYYYKAWSGNSNYYSAGITDNASITMSAAAILARYDGGSGGGFSSAAATEAALPVELLFFSASYVDNAVKLFWQTATEINNYGFEIERASTPLSTSYNVTLSEVEEWETVAFVNGYGNSNSPKFYTFTDNNPPSGNIKYRLKQIDFDGKFEYSDELEIAVGVPKKFALKDNYPNPFNPSTTIKFDIPKGQIVSLKIYDLLGAEVKSLVNESKQPGSYAIYWHGKNEFGKQVASGLYIYVLRSNEFVKSKKMMLLK